MPRHAARALRMGEPQGAIRVIEERRVLGTAECRVPGVPEILAHCHCISYALSMCAMAGCGEGGDNRGPGTG